MLKTNLTYLTILSIWQCSIILLFSIMNRAKEKLFSFTKLFSDAWTSVNDPDNIWQRIWNGRLCKNVRVIDLLHFSIYKRISSWSRKFQGFRQFVLFYLRCALTIILAISEILLMIYPCHSSINHFNSKWVPLHAFKSILNSMLLLGLWIYIDKNRWHLRPNHI